MSRARRGAWERDRAAMAEAVAGRDASRWLFAYPVAGVKAARAVSAGLGPTDPGSRPEGEPHDQADSGADQDVFDADQTCTPSDRLRKVEQGDDQHRERGLAGEESSKLRQIGGEERSD